MHRLMVVVVLALPLVSVQAFACGMEVDEGQPTALADRMAMVDDAAAEVVGVATAPEAPEPPPQAGPAPRS